MPKLQKMRTLLQVAKRLHEHEHRTMQDAFWLCTRCSRPSFCCLPTLQDARLGLTPGLLHKGLLLLTDVVLKRLIRDVLAAAGIPSAAEAPLRQTYP